MENFTSEKIRLHLQRILKTPSFSESTVLTRFLTFIVNETLEGRSHELKEYTIAIDALKKDPSFNPQIDSIVRIHAGRLRRALKEFYYEDGVNEEIQIIVRKGSYVPAFVKNTGFLSGDYFEQGEPHLSVTKPLCKKHKQSLAVLPFVDISEEKTHTSFLKGLDIFLSTRLTNNPSLCVTSHLSSAHLDENVADVHQAGQLLNASFILSGCVQFDKHFRLHVLLDACEAGEQLLGITIERSNIESIDLFSLQKEIVSEIYAAVNETLVNIFASRPSYQEAGNTLSILTLERNPS